MNVILYLFAIVASFFLGANASLNSNTLQAQDASAPSWDTSATAESLGLEPYAPPQGIFPLFPWDHLQSWGADYQSLEDAMASMRECEFTLSAFVDTLDKAKEANKNGLLCLYEAGVEIFDDRELTPQEIAEKCAKIDERIEKVVQETKDLPNVIGYYIVDEPGAYKFKALAAAVAAVKKYAPKSRVYDLIKWTLNRNAQSEQDVVEPTEEQLNGLTPEAIREIKKHRILDFIATKEKIRPNQAAVDARLQEMAKAYHVDFETLKGHFRQSGRINQLRDELRVQMAADFIVGIRPAAEENK